MILKCQRYLTRGRKAEKQDGSVPVTAYDTRRYRAALEAFERADPDSGWLRDFPIDARHSLADHVGELRDVRENRGSASPLTATRHAWNCLPWLPRLESGEPRATLSDGLLDPTICWMRATRMAQREAAPGEEGPEGHFL